MAGPGGRAETGPRQQGLGVGSERATGERGAFASTLDTLISPGGGWIKRTEIYSLPA